MSKPALLLVDREPKSRRVLEVNLRKAGYEVFVAQNGAEAWDRLTQAPPELVIADLTQEAAESLQLLTRGREELGSRLPLFLFITRDDQVEEKKRALEAGATELVDRPVYVKELLTRVKILLQRSLRTKMETSSERTAFSGSLVELGVIDLLQSLEAGRKTGVVTIESDGRKGEIYVRQGRVIDAALGRLQGEDAVYRMFLWSEGVYSGEFRNLRRDEKISLSPQGLVLEGLRRLEEWTRLLDGLPPVHHVCEVDYSALADRLGELPDEVNTVLRLFDGHRSLLQVIDDADFGPIETLTVLGKLYAEGILYDTVQRPARVKGALPSPELERWLSGLPANALEAAPEQGSLPAKETPALPAKEPSPPADAAAEKAPARPAPPPAAAEEIPPTPEQDPTITLPPVDSASLLRRPGAAPSQELKAAVAEPQEATKPKEPEPSKEPAPSTPKEPESSAQSPKETEAADEDEDEEPAPRPRARKAPPEEPAPASATDEEDGDDLAPSSGRRTNTWLYIGGGAVAFLLVLWLGGVFSSAPPPKFPPASTPADAEPDPASASVPSEPVPASASLPASTPASTSLPSSTSAPASVPATAPAPAPVVLSPEDKAKYETAVSKGTELFVANQLDQAIASYQQALTLDPSGKNAMVGIGTIFFEKGAQAFDAGRVAEASKSIDESIVRLETAVKVHPDSHEAYYSLAVAYEFRASDKRLSKDAAGDLAKARAGYEAYLKLQPNGPSAQDAKDALKALSTP